MDEGSVNRVAVVFDLGGVLVENTMFDELAEILPEPTPETVLKTQWLASPAVRAFELGHSSNEAFAAAMVGEFSLNMTASAFLKTFTAWPKGFYPGTSEMLVELRQNTTIACLSNSNALHWTDTIASQFDLAFSSHLIGMIKPDVDVFDHVTKEIGKARDEIIFFDDSKANVDAAITYGWQAHLTQGLVDVRAVLEQRGLLGTSVA